MSLISWRHAAGDKHILEPVKASLKAGILREDHLRYAIWPSAPGAYSDEIDITENARWAGRFMDRPFAIPGLTL